MHCRHGQVEVDDVSFQIELGGDDNTTTDDGSTTSDASTPSTPSARTPEQDIFGSANEPEEPNTAIRISDAAPEPEPTEGRSDPYDIPLVDATTPVAGRTRASGSDTGQEDLLQLSARARDALGSARSLASQRTILLEEVGESPIKAPGTGQRRSLRSSEVSSSAAKLQQMISSVDLEDADPLSSPSEQRTSRIRRSSTRPRGSPQAPEAKEPDELSPEQTYRGSRLRNEASPDLSSPQKPKTPTPEPPPEPEKAATPPTEEHNSPEVEEASPVEVAKVRRGRKRRSPVQAVEEPAEASVATEEPANETTEELRPSPIEPVEESPEPARKRRRKPEKVSPAKQKQGRRKPAEAPAESQEAPSNPAKKRRAKRTGGEGEGNDLVILTQRFSKRRRVSEGETQEFNIHTADVPYANRSGVNCIDALSTLFSEVIDTATSSLQETRVRVTDAAAKREVNTKIRALKAFQEELRIHFLGHVRRTVSAVAR
jgi:hypothetical protein